MGRGWKRSNRHRASPSPDSSANVCDRLPDALASTVARRMRATDHQPDPLIAQAELEALARTLDRSHPGAAVSLREGLAETLTIGRLGVPPTLDRTSEDVVVPDHGAGLVGWSDPDRT